MWNWFGLVWFVCVEFIREEEKNLFFFYQQNIQTSMAKCNKSQSTIHSEQERGREREWRFSLIIVGMASTSSFVIAAAADAEYKDYFFSCGKLLVAWDQIQQIEHIFIIA